ncbi:MAG: NAD(P)H-dependent glycerol-3-phosphate dehydrogenase [Candidatus Woesearchaeota archaeon]
MITIVGAGKFGQAISKLLGSNKHQLVDIEKDGTYSPATVEKIKKADYLVLCVPSGNLDDCVNMLSGIVRQDAKILSCTKGIYDNLKTPSEVIKTQINNPLAALMGPNLAIEIMEGRPAMAVIAGDNAQEWARFFSVNNFKVILGTDTVGIEFGGAIKNIVALGAGLLDGYYETNTCNTMGSFVAFALREIQHLYKHKSNSEIPELSFIGDLFATCMSENSRNHQFGHKFGIALREGKPLPKPEQTVEGYRTLQIVQKYSEKNKIAMPTITALYNVFFKNGKVEDIIATWR